MDLMTRYWQGALGVTALAGLLAGVAERIVRDPKSGHRFSEKITHKQSCVIPKSGHRFSKSITHQQKSW